MPITVRVEVDPAPVLAILEALQSPDLEQVAALALNDTAANGRVAAAQEIAPRIGLPSKAVKDALTVERARPDHLEAAVVARGKPIPMIQFRPRGGTGRRPVSVKIGGDVEVYRRAFIATMRSGYKGVFERIGRERGPLRQLYGPSVPGMFARSDVQPAVQVALRDRLLVNLTRQLERRMRQKQGKHKRPA